ncbi:unnamed protein product [Schistosoma margrebowiei]|uniref:Uncharacterized protein n=1 Tax=Schistosoma margrebowiei TaxID=48269 RepID=A0A183M8D8_9TREM|nr:unnamed protein product [Schistosoma margrebowiei]
MHSFFSFFTCLHYSVGHGAWQVVNLILDTGHAHPDHINRSGFSPIMIATLSNITDSSALKTLSRLFSMGDVNLCTNTSARQSPLMLAALHGGVDICSLLIAHGANINAQDASGNTALMYAIEHGHIDVVKCLLGCRDLNLTLVDNCYSELLTLKLLIYIFNFNQFAILSNHFPMSLVANYLTLTCLILTRTPQLSLKVSYPVLTNLY